MDGGYQLAPGASLPPLVLDDEEAVALGVGLQAALQGGSVAGIAESAARAFTKVVQVMPPRLRRRVDALAAMTVPAGWGPVGPTVDPDVLLSVAQACRDVERLAFAYTARNGVHTNRLAEPHRLVFFGRNWYLVAWDLQRRDWRSFRLDRVSGITNTGAPFRPRSVPGGDPAAFVRAGIDSAPAQFAVEAVVHAPAETVRARVGRWATVDEVDSNRCILSMTSDSLDWPTMALGVVEAPFEVLAPRQLRTQVHSWGRHFTASP